METTEYRVVRKGSSGRGIVVKPNPYATTAKTSPVMLTLEKSPLRDWERGNFSVVLTRNEIEQLSVALAYYLAEGEKDATETGTG